MVTISLVTLFGWSVVGQQTPAPKAVWEHAVVSSIGDNSARLSQLGTEGWELVAVRSEDKFAGKWLVDSAQSPVSPRCGTKHRLRVSKVQAHSLAAEREMLWE